MVICKYSNICDVYDNCPSSGCGLESFLNTIKVEKQKYPKKTQLISSLEGTYLKAWNENSSSRARGGATGRAFEKWVIENLSSRGITIEKGRQDFKFGKFQVDAIIPSKRNPKAILEMKINSDRQHSLMFSGLINQRVNPDLKIGYVPFYKPSKDVIKILETWKIQHPKIFDYFPIEQGWSNSLQRLDNFIN